MLAASCKTDRPSPFADGGANDNYQHYMSDYRASPYKWGYIDTNGKLVIKNKYDDCRDFSEGLAAVNLDGLWTYIDRTGKVLMPPRYRTAQRYSEGIGVVRTFEDTYLLYSTTGEAISDTLYYDEVGPYYSGRARVKQGDYYGYINSAGQQLDSLTYRKASHYQDGYAIVEGIGGPTLIDDTGSSVLPTGTSTSKVHIPREGVVRLKSEAGFRYYDLQRSQWIGSTYARGTDFQLQYALVHDTRSYHLMDKTGKLTRLPYEKVVIGGEGKWIYRQGQNYGYLNNDGSVLTLPNHDTATRFRSGMAAVEHDGQWGYIDSLGTLAIDYQFPLAWDFVGDRARSINREGFSFIDKNGDYIISPYYIEVRDFADGLARVQIYRQ